VILRPLPIPGQVADLPLQVTVQGDVGTGTLMF